MVRRLISNLISSLAANDAARPSGNHLLVALGLVLACETLHPKYNSFSPFLSDPPIELIIQGNFATPGRELAMQ